MADKVFKMDMSKLEKGLESLEDRARAAIEMKIESKYVPKLRAYAQKNARWTDRTGEARRKLDADYEVVSKGFKLHVAHGVDYGIWLELANEKRYAILPETIQKVGKEEIVPDFENFMSKL